MLLLEVASRIPSQANRTTRDWPAHLEVLLVIIAATAGTVYCAWITARALTSVNRWITWSLVICLGILEPLLVWIALIYFAAAGHG